MIGFANDEDATRELREAENERDTALALMEAEEARAVAQTVKRYMEGPYDQWGFRNDDYWAGRRDQGHGSQGSRYRSNLYSREARISDRADGRYKPFYETYWDLMRALAKARNLADFSATSIGAVEALNCYVMGGDWEYAAIEKKHLAGGDAQLAAELQPVVQELIDDFLERNDWLSDLDGEIHDASREDGDLFVQLSPSAGRSNASLIRMEHCRPPEHQARLNDWLDCGIPCRWDFGVHVVWNEQLKRYDRERPLGYHFVFDEQGRDWDYLPTWPQPHLLDDTRCVTHLKRNVDRIAARGVTDFWQTIADLEGNEKLKNSIRSGASIQARIAWIIEHASGASKSQATTQSEVGEIYKAIMGSGTKSNDEYSVTDLPDNAVIRTGGNKYHAGPLGSLNSPVFIDVSQFIRRSIGHRWLMPEFIISADASNANFASTLVAHHPFVRARKKDQNWYKRRFRTIIWKAVRIAYLAGWFDNKLSGSRPRWADIKRVIEIMITAPSPETRDMAANTQRNDTLNQRGILSAEAWAADEGLDPDDIDEARNSRPVADPVVVGGGETSPSADFSSLTTEQIQDIHTEAEARLWEALR